MDKQTQRDYDDSAYDFMRVVCPALSRNIGGTIKLSDSNDIVDRKGGIDAWIDNGLGLQSMAFRVQWGKDYKSFTIRESRASGSDTEFAKRRYSINTPGTVFPYYTVQAYVSEKRTGHLLSVSYCLTSDLYAFINSPKYKPVTLTAYDGGAKFLVVYWSDMDSCGVPFTIVPIITKLAVIQPAAIQLAVTKPSLDNIDWTARTAHEFEQFKKRYNK